MCSFGASLYIVYRHTHNLFHQLFSSFTPPSWLLWRWQWLGWPRNQPLQNKSTCKTLWKLIAYVQMIIYTHSLEVITTSISLVPPPSFLKNWSEHPLHWSHMHSCLGFLGNSVLKFFTCKNYLPVQQFQVNTMAVNDEISLIVCIMWLCLQSFPLLYARREG